MHKIDLEYLYIKFNKDPKNKRVYNALIKSIKDIHEGNAKIEDRSVDIDYRFNIKDINEDFIM